MSTPPDYFNPLVYEGNGVGGFEQYMPPIYLDGHRYPSLPLDSSDFAYFRLGSGVNYVPSGSDNDIRGDEVYRADIVEVLDLWEHSYRIRIQLDSLVGPFEFGEIGIYKADGTIISLFTSTEFVVKRDVTDTVPNNVIIEATYLYRDGVATASATWSVYSRGPTGIGLPGEQGDKGDKGDPGDSVGITFSSANTGLESLVFGEPVHVYVGGIRRALPVAGRYKVKGLLMGDVLIGDAEQSMAEGPLFGTVQQWETATGMPGGLVPEAIYYLGVDGKITPTAPVETAEYLCVIGRALDSTTLLIQVEPPILL